MKVVSVRTLIIVAVSLCIGFGGTVGAGFGLLGWQLPHQVDEIKRLVEVRTVRNILAQECNFQFWSHPNATQNWERLLEYSTVDERLLFLISNGWVRVPAYEAQ